MASDIFSQEQDVERRRRRLSRFARILDRGEPWTARLDASFADTRCHLIACDKCRMDPYCNKLLYIMEEQGIVE